MKRLLALALVAVPISVGLAAPERPWFPKNFTLAPHGVMHYASACEPGRPVVVIASGSSIAPLGIYVYNARGQCVGCDDEPNLLGDERLVAWTPTDAGPYDVEIRSLGAASNEVEAVFRGTSGGER